MTLADSATRTVPTPDFYSYPWTPISSVEPNGRFLEIQWSDGAHLRAFDLWLRENAVDNGGVDLATREGLLDPADLADDIAVRSAELTDDGALIVKFAPDDVQSEFHPGWLRHVADGTHRASSWLPKARSWTAATMPEPPTSDGSVVLELSLIHI